MPISWFLFTFGKLSSPTFRQLTEIKPCPSESWLELCRTVKLRGCSSSYIARPLQEIFHTVADILFGHRFLYRFLIMGLFFFFPFFVGLKSINVLNCFYFKSSVNRFFLHECHHTLRFKIPKYIKISAFHQKICHCFLVAVSHLSLLSLRGWNWADSSCKSATTHSCPKFQNIVKSGCFIRKSATLC